MRVCNRSASPHDSNGPRGVEAQSVVLKNSTCWESGSSSVQSIGLGDSGLTDDETDCAAVVPVNDNECDEHDFADGAGKPWFASAMRISWSWPSMPGISGTSRMVDLTFLTSAPSEATMLDKEANQRLNLSMQGVRYASCLSYLRGLILTSATDRVREIEQ